MHLTKDTPDYWVPRILGALGKSVEAILQVGRELIDAKAALPGEFERMVELEMPFSPRSAQMLMAVANDARIAKANHGSDLPASWRTLYELTKLNEDQWKNAKLAGLIRADVQRKEITAFRRGPKKPAQLKPYSDPGDAEVALMDFFDKFIERYPKEHLPRLAHRLRQLARDITRTKTEEAE